MNLESVSEVLASHGEDHVVVSADKVKVTTKIEIPKGSTFMIVDFREGPTLRGRWTLEDPTKLKLCNALGRQLGRGFVEQRPGLTMELKFHLPVKAPAAGEIINIMNIRSPEIKFEVKLIDKATKNTIYSVSDITGEVELVRV